MSYQSVLPQIFPYRVEISRFHVPRIIEALTGGDHVYPVGSSFAVTTDAHGEDTVYLWLSDASLRRLQGHDLWSNRFKDVSR